MPSRRARSFSFKDDSMNIHTLTNGATVISASSHGYEFSDGTFCKGNPDLASKLALTRNYTLIKTIRGMAVNSCKFTLTEDQLKILSQLPADIVIVPFAVLTSLREMGIRDQFPNVLCFNNISMASRVVDINNWSY